MTDEEIATAVADKLLDVDLTRYSRRTLDISTGHISAHTADALTRDGRALHASPWFDYGWIIWTDQAYLTYKDHPELAALVRFALERGYEHLKLDCDAELLPEALGFPTFNW